MNLYDLLASRFPAEGAAPCLILPDGRRVSYAELESQSARYGALLVEAGMKPGERVAAQVEKSAEALFLYLGCLRAGGVFLPLNPAYTRGEVAFFLEATSATVEGPYDVSLVEGSIGTPHDVERIQEVRAASKVLVTIGACATAAIRRLARA